MQVSPLKTLQQEVQGLATKVEQRWKKLNYELDQLPKICSEELNLFQLQSVPDLETVLRDLSQVELPIQNFPHGEFSDFPITLFRTDRLLVDIYYWYRSDTTIHNHHFCGAFKVIAGESYQIDYTFEKTRSISEGLDEGVMTQKSNEHLKLGTVHPISLRDQFIHHVFHLGKPTITLCIRTPILEGEGLASFIYPKYRVVLSPITTNQHKWLQALKLQLEQNPESKPEIPWDNGEIIRILFRSSSTMLTLNQQVASHLLNHLEAQSFLPDFFDLLQKQRKLHDKLKKFGLMTGPLKGSV